MYHILLRLFEFNGFRKKCDQTQIKKTRYNSIFQDKWLTALKQRSTNVYIDKKEHLFLFYDLLKNYKEYEILNVFDHEIINLFTMPHDQMDVSSICDILEHLVRYELVKVLANNGSRCFYGVF